MTSFNDLLTDLKKCEHMGLRILQTYSEHSIAIHTPCNEFQYHKLLNHIKQKYSIDYINSQLHTGTIPGQSSASIVIYFPKSY